MSPRSGRALLCLSLIVAGCGGEQRKSSQAPVPELVRAPTPGDALWARLPAGADLVLEVDLARLRANAVVGPLLGLVAPPQALRDADLLEKAETMLVAIYEVGDAPRQLIILKGKGLAAQSMPALGTDTLALGDPDLLRLTEGLQDSSPTMSDDQQLWRMRSTSMPDKADAAALRVTARLGFDARVEIASKLAISDVPIAMTIWADVVDDLALVAELESEDSGGAERLERALLGLRTRLSGLPFLRYIAISPALRNTRVTRSGTSVRLVFVLSPKRLRLVVERLSKQLTVSTKQETPAEAL